MALSRLQYKLEECEKEKIASQTKIKQLEEEKKGNQGKVRQLEEENNKLRSMLNYVLQTKLNFVNGNDV